MQTAFITGITGQDGAWVAKHLLDRGYRVYGGVRRSSSVNDWRLRFLGIRDRVELVDFDLLEYSNMFNVIKELRPDEFYNLAAQSFVATSFKQPIVTSMIDGMGVASLLDILHTVSPETKFYQASTSEMFGKAQEVPQKETTPFYPRSPYGVAKLYAHWMTVNYRESYGMYACSGICFNHESELRGPEFVTRKVTMNAAQWACGENIPLEIGNLDAERDWGDAQDYVEAMHLMLQQAAPDDFVIATGVSTKIRVFVELAFACTGRHVQWEGTGVEETGRDRQSGELLVKVNPSHYRPAEVERLRGNASKAKRLLGWESKTALSELIERMVKNDIKFLKEK